MGPGLAAILERALAAPAPYRRAVATDADGTLWAADVGDRLFLALGQRRDFRGEALAALRVRARQLLGDGTPGDAADLAATLMARYEAGEIAVGPMCDLEAEALGARSVADLDALMAEVAEGVAAAVRPDVRDLLHAAHERAMSIHVVSGSLGAAVEVALRRAGIPFDTVTGAVLQVAGGAVLPKLAGPIPLFEGKVRALQATGAWPAALGLGDGGWDATFLRDVHVPVLVHPKPALVEAMAGVSRAVRL